MRRTPDCLCHLILLDHALRQIAVECTPVGWLLPVIGHDAHDVIGPLAQAAFTTMSADVSIVHSAAADACNTLVERYCLATTSSDLLAREGLRWRNLDDLEARDAAIGSQWRTLQLCRERLAQPVAPFDTPLDVHRVMTWVQAQLSPCAHAAWKPVYSRCSRELMVFSVPTLLGSTPHGRATLRAGRRVKYPLSSGDAGGEVVLLFFKGGPARIANEAALTQALRRLAPAHFAEVIAFDADRHWLLTREFPAAPIQPRTCGEDTIARVVATMMRVQHLAGRSREIRTVLASRHRTCAELVHLAEAAIGSCRQAWMLARAEEEIGEPRLPEWLHALCIGLDRASPPHTWVHTDLWEANILADRRSVGFIDLEDGCLAPPALCLWRFFDDASLLCTPAYQELAMAAYADSWRRDCSSASLARWIAAMPILARIMKLVVEHERLRARTLHMPLALAAAAERRALTPLVQTVRALAALHEVPITR